MISDKLDKLIGSEYTAMTNFFADAILDRAKTIDDEYLDNRYRELAMSNVMSDLLRHNVWIVAADDRDGVNMHFPDVVPKDVEARVRESGPDIASLFLSNPTLPHKDSLSELTVLTLLCSRMMVDKIATDMTSYKERLAIMNGVLKIMDIITHNMMNVMPDPEEIGSA